MLTFLLWEKNKEVFLLQRTQNDTTIPSGRKEKNLSVANAAAVAAWAP